MITVETKVKIPFLWGKAAFKKSKWNQVNLIVGPNGSGKTLLAEEISSQFEKKGYKVDFLRSERSNQNELLEKLKTDSELCKKIETVISSMFGKTIKFKKNPDGNVVPVVVNKAWDIEYGFQEGECHGLKEILTLLIALYGLKSSVLILDEPELHLHPQFQLFFMNEIRKAAKNDSSRIFFLVTHSPYFIDLRFAEDILGVVVCHVNRVPTCIDLLDKNTESMLRRFLPRFNTYHKQFFFSDNQIFVEGYTDQQMFTILLDCMENFPGVVGTSVIDVGGKDELGVFFTVCSLLGTDGRIITDMDSLFAGKLRDVVCEDSRPHLWLEKQYEKQLPFYRLLFTRHGVPEKITLEKLVSRLESYLVEIGKSVVQIDFPINPEIDIFVQKLKALYEKYEKPEGLDTFKTVVLMGVILLGEKLEDILPIPLARTIPVVFNLSNLIFAAFETARVYVLPYGCIEHFYTQSSVDYMPVSGKDKLFHMEFEAMVNMTPEELRKNYPELIWILTKACAAN